MLPDGRTTDYAVWRACERMGILPPNAHREWDQCSVDMQALLLAYNQVRTIEEQKFAIALAGASPD